jgi:hypothetical protein
MWIVEISPGRCNSLSVILKSEVKNGVAFKIWVNDQIFEIDALKVNSEDLCSREREFLDVRALVIGIEESDLEFQRDVLAFIVLVDLCKFQLFSNLINQNDGEVVSENDILHQFGVINLVWKLDFIPLHVGCQKLHE